MYPRCMVFVFWANAFVAPFTGHELLDTSNLLLHLFCGIEGTDDRAREDYCRLPDILDEVGECEKYLPYT